MSSKFVQVRNQIEADLENVARKIVDAISDDLTIAENFTKNLFTELKPFIEADLKNLAVVGIAAGAGALSGGATLTLSSIEAAAVLAGRAMLNSAKNSGAQLSEQSALALAAAIGVPTPPTPNGVNK